VLKQTERLHSPIFNICGLIFFFLFLNSLYYLPFHLTVLYLGKDNNRETEFYGREADWVIFYRHMCVSATKDLVLLVKEKSRIKIAENLVFQEKLGTSPLTLIRFLYLAQNERFLQTQSQWRPDPNAPVHKCDPQLPPLYAVVRLLLWKPEMRHFALLVYSKHRRTLAASALKFRLIRRL
jgi:hypothetical protein